MADIFKCIFLHENGRISFKISPKFVPKGPIKYSSIGLENVSGRIGDKPLCGQMLVSLLRHRPYASLGLNELR